MAYKTANELREGLRRAPPDFSIAATVAAADEVELTDEFYRVDIDDIAVVTRRSALAQATFLGERTRRQAEGRLHARLVGNADAGRVVAKCPCGATVRLHANGQSLGRAHCRHCTHPLIFTDEARTASAPPGPAAITSGAENSSTSAVMTISIPRLFD